MTSPVAKTAARRRTGASTDFVFVINDLVGLQPCHDSSVALMEAAQRHGHRILITTAGRLGYAEGQATALCRSVTLQPAVLHEHQWIIDPEWFRLGPACLYQLGDAAAVFMRTDPPVGTQYLRATYLLDLVDAAHTLMVNSSSGVRNANEKLFALRVPELGPPTIVTADRPTIRAILAEWGKAVLKPTDGMAGRGILLLDQADPNVGSMLDTATDRGRCQVVVQRWLPAAAQGDRRVIVLDGRPVGVARRIAGPGDFRCNMAAGAGPVADVVTERDREICARLAPLLREHGLHFVGIDVIGGCLTEVNVTSPTGIREIDALTGSHLAEDVISWAEARCRAMARTA